MAATDLTLRPFFRRAISLFPEKEIVSRTPEGTVRYTYREYGDRVNALASALSELGVEPRDRVGTLAWNHHRHLEAYFAIPLMGAQLHTVHTQLSDDDIAYIINDAADRVLLVDPGESLATVERIWDRLESVESVVVLDDGPADTDLPAEGYETLLDASDGPYDWPELHEDQPASMCYTTGTTGRPKGCEFTQKMAFTNGMLMLTAAAIGFTESDVVMPAVPMFHVNSWEFPYATTAVGAKQVYPGPSPSVERLARFIEDESVTITSGVPTIWIDMLEHLEDNEVDLSSLERIVMGGNAVPKDVIRRYDREHGVDVDHVWGATETMSVSTRSTITSKFADDPYEARVERLATQGVVLPGLETRVVDEDGNEVPPDGESLGELQIRGGTIIEEYYNRPDATEESFEDGWFKTGDIVTVDPDGYIEIVDRKSDLIKSGGEWISSIALEDGLMSHEAVVEAVVVAVSHDRWGERPVAFVVRKGGSDVSPSDLRSFLSSQFPGWWLPDTVVFVEDVPTTATNKIDKNALRERAVDVELRWTPGE